MPSRERSSATMTFANPAARKAAATAAVSLGGFFSGACADDQRDADSERSRRRDDSGRSRWGRDSGRNRRGGMRFGLKGLQCPFRGVASGLREAVVRPFGQSRLEVLQRRLRRPGQELELSPVRKGVRALWV